MKNCGVRKAHGLNFIRPKGEYLNYSLLTIHFSLFISAVQQRDAKPVSAAVSTPGDCNKRITPALIRRRKFVQMC